MYDYLHSIPPLNTQLLAIYLITARQYNKWDHLHPVPPFSTPLAICGNKSPSILGAITYILFHHPVPSQPPTITTTCPYRLQDYLRPIPPSSTPSAIYHYNSPYRQYNNRITYVLFRRSTLS